MACYDGCCRYVGRIRRVDDCFVIVDIGDEGVGTFHHYQLRKIVTKPVKEYLVNELNLIDPAEDCVDMFNGAYGMVKVRIVK